MVDSVPDSVKEVAKELKRAKKSHVLNIPGLKLKTLPDGIIEIASKLKEINVEDNGLSSTTNFNADFCKLTILNIKNNLLNDLSSSIGDLAVLEDLNLSENKLAKLPVELSKCISLTSLDLHRNKLTSFPKEICLGLTNLQTLKLSINELTEIPSEITYLQKLKVFHARYNLITDLPATDWYNMESLEEFNIANNNLSVLPPELVDITTLRVLSIGGNSFKSAEFQELAQKGDPTDIFKYLRTQRGQYQPQKTKKIPTSLSPPTTIVSDTSPIPSPVSGLPTPFSNPPCVSTTQSTLGKGYAVSPRSSGRESFSSSSTPPSSVGDKGSLRKGGSFIQTWKSKKTVRNQPPKEYTYPLASPRGKVFGAPIDHESVVIPPIIEKSIKFLEIYLETEGLFRISGNADDISDIKRSFDAGTDYDISNEKNPHNVASLLKLYLRELPEPLFTYEKYDEFIKANSSTHSQKDRLIGARKLIQELPPFNRTVLGYLIKFLHAISKHWRINKMTPTNLAIVFAPNLLYPKEREMMKLMEENFHSNGILEAIIEQYNFVFGNVDEIESATAVEPNIGNTKSISNA